MGSPEQERQPEIVQDHTRPPPPPSPSRDTSIVPPIKSPILEGIDHLTPENVDIFQLESFAALKLLCRGVELLVHLTGDIPPTPFIQSPPELAEAQSDSQSTPISTPVKVGTPIRTPVPGWNHASKKEAEHIDGVPFMNTPIGSPEAHLSEPNIVHGHNAQPLHVQHNALARKFFSKRPPPISLEDYLTRLHKYCPMSTAVYLATSCYITRLAVEEKTLYVTPRNVHRLVLAGIRTAMKALEDLSWPHGRVAKVGGVSEAELGRLEITFCFLMSFNLRVTADMLINEAKSLVKIANGRRNEDVEFASLDGILQLKMPERRSKEVPPSESGDSLDLQRTSSSAEKRKASSSLPMRPVTIDRSVGITT